MGKLHHALTGTGAVAVAAAAATRGTLLARRALVATSGATRIGHPAGTLRVGAEVRQEGGTWQVARVMLSRSARRLMDGWVYVPEEIAAPRERASE
jgi:2-methylaconitate cis-trans-isomerase PrpF